jgi:hypothetical protein
VSGARQFEPAVRAVADWLERLPGPVRRLEARDLQAYDRQRGFVVGWRMPVAFDDGTRRLDVLLDEWFPLAAPRIALVDRPEFLTWPHVERDGVLCLLPTTAACDPAVPQATVQHVLDCSCQLIQECIAGTNLDDFRQEFLSYWGWTVPESSTRAYSLLNPVPPTRAIRLWTGSSHYLLGETDAAIANWLANRRGDRIPAKDTTASAAMLWLDRPLLPSEYPKCGADLLALARRTGGNEMLSQMVFDEPDRIVVGIGSTTGNGPCLAAVTLSAPQLFSKSKNRSTRTLNAGFRKGKMPADVLVSRYFSGNRVIPSNVDRGDVGWVHGRDRNPHAERLLNSHAVVLGCGSVGAPVTLALMQAGLGRLSLVDPDVLKWSNISRHPLGASSVDSNKADALADRIRRDFPHVNDVTSFPRRWQDVLRLAPQLLQSADLIVSAMGDWEAEGALNDWHVESGRAHPIVYGWTEPHASAGHAVAICRTGGCFSCGLDNHGAHRSPATTWPRPTYLQEPACGAVYQPYGAIEVGHIVSMVADVALRSLMGNVEESTEWVWTGSKGLLESVGGAWDPSWRSVAEAKGPAPFVKDRPWAARPDCIACGK